MTANRHDTAARLLNGLPDIITRMAAQPRDPEGAVRPKVFPRRFTDCSLEVAEEAFRSMRDFNDYMPIEEAAVWSQRAADAGLRARQVTERKRKEEHGSDAWWQAQYEFQAWKTIEFEVQIRVDNAYDMYPDEDDYDGEPSEW